MTHAPRNDDDDLAGDGLVGDGLVGDGLVGDGLVGDGLVGDGGAAIAGDGWLDPRGHEGVSVSADFVARTLERVLEQRADPALYELLAEYAAPEPSAEFVTRTERAITADDATAGSLAAALAHYAAPAPSPDFVARTLQALAESGVRSARVRRVRWLVGAAAAALALVTLGLWLGRAPAGAPAGATAGAPADALADLATARRELSPAPWATAWAAELAPAGAAAALPPAGGALLLAHLAAAEDGR